jgi:hypothetical protein
LPSLLLIPRLRLLGIIHTLPKASLYNGLKISREAIKLHMSSLIFDRCVYGSWRTSLFLCA